MKYPSDKRKKVLDYYFAHDASLAEVARRFGYPHRITLGAWAKQDERYRKGKRWKLSESGWGLSLRTRYSQEHKRTAVRLVTEGGMSYAGAARAMGMRQSSSVFQWVGELAEEGGGTAMGKHRAAGRAGTRGDRRSEGSAKPEEVARLERTIREQQIALDVANAKIELLKKESGFGGDALSTGDLVEIADLLKPKHGLSAVLRELGLPRSTYYYRAARAGSERDAARREAVLGVFRQSGGAYGYRRIWAALKRTGVTISQRVISRIMREMGLAPRTERRERPYRAYKGHCGKPVPDWLGRDFSADAPNQKWVTDITQVCVNGAKVYVSPIIDLFNGEVVSCAASLHPDMRLVMAMLWKAIQKLGDDDIPILHSDMGCQYTSPSWRLELERQCIVQSMSRKGNCLDNACAESFFARMKLEMYHGREFGSVSEFAARLEEYVEWYNRDRVKARLGGLSPLQYREAWEGVRAA